MIYKIQFFIHDLEGILAPRAGKTGLEPVTYSLTSCYSNQLSYFPQSIIGFILFVERSAL
jgi:hypothetical protein